MAITAIAIVQREQIGFSNFVVSTLSLDNSYPTGGWPLTAQQLGVGTAVGWVSVVPKGGYTFVYVHATSKLQAFWGGGAGAVQTEVTNGTDLSAVTGVRVMAFGH